MYSNDVAQVNDRITRLVERLRQLGADMQEDPLHPAVFEAETSAQVAAAAYEQLAYTRAGRERIAAKHGRDGSLTLEEALALAAPKPTAPATDEPPLEQDITETNGSSQDAQPAAPAAEATADSPHTSLVAALATRGARRRSE